MGLPSIAPSAKNALGSSLLGRLLGTAPAEDLDQPGEPLPPLKFTLGQEPHTPRKGSPGFQDGHWVIARPKLATPIIYQHARSPANDQSSLGLGATTPPTTAGQAPTHRAGSGKRASLTHHTTAWGVIYDNISQEKGDADSGGYDGTISAWGEAAESQDGEQHHGSRSVDGLRRRDEGGCHEDGGENDAGDEQEEKRHHELPPPPLAAETDLSSIQACVNDLYFAVAHPRFDTDPICLRRQRENASAAAGALKNKLSMVNRCTNPAVRPTDKAGADRAEALETGARMLMRSLSEGFPFSMRARAVAALHEVLTFQDVRATVADATPFVVPSLVGLLRQEGASGSRGRESPKQREEEALSARQGGSRCQPQLRPKKEEHARLRDGQGSLVKIAEKGKHARKELCPRTCEASLHAAACLRILALSDGLPQMMTSASAIPALVDGVKKGSSLMKSVCGGCLTSLALCEDESCSEMIDFGVLPLLLGLIRDENRMLEQTAWSLLAAIMRVREARHAFVGAGGLNDVGEMLARKRRRRGSNRFLFAGQESAMRVLLSLCEEEEDEEDDDEAINRRGGESSLATSPTIPSVLLLGEDKARGAESESDDDGSGGGGGNIDKAGTRRGGKRRKLATRKEGGRTSSEEKPSAAPGRTYSGSDWVRGHSGSSSSISSSSGSSSHRGEGASSHRLPTAVEDFVSRDDIFRAVLRQMRWGTTVSMEKAAEILKLMWKACSRSQTDSTMPAVLDMLASEVWILKSAAAKVILHVYVEDEQRLRCAVSGGVETLVDTIRTRAPQMQAGTLSALLSLCEHPDVPAIVAGAGGLDVLAEYLTTTRDVTTRYVVLAVMKVILICERSAVEPHLPDMLVSEHVLGACDEIDEFVRVFVEKRKGSDYLRVGATNVCRFTANEIDGYKTTFKQLDKDASGALDTRELALLLKQLKVDSRKKTVKKVLVTVDKDHSGAIEFDEFLDIMWDIKHSRGLLLSRAGVFLEETLTAAQAALLSKRRHMVKTPSPDADHGDLRSRATTTTTSAISISSVDEEMSVEEGVDILQKQKQKQKQEEVSGVRPATASSSAFSATMARGKEAALSFSPRIARKT